MGCGKSSANANDPEPQKDIMERDENEPTKQSNNFGARDEDEEAVIEDQGKGVVVDPEEEEEDIILTNVASPEAKTEQKAANSTSPSGQISPDPQPANSEPAENEEKSETEVIAPQQTTPEKKLDLQQVGMADLDLDVLAVENEQETPAHKDQ